MQLAAPVIALGFLLVLAGIVFRGIRESMWINILCTCVEAAGLLIVIAVGISHWGTVDYFEVPTASHGFTADGFEVGLALRGKQELGLTQYQIARMFTECSLVMFVVQAIVFSTWVKPEATRWLIAPALAVLATGLFLVPHASNFTLMLVVIGAVAASAGILSPIVTYWISSTAGEAQGAELGKQTAASSLGVTVGSAAGGLLFNVPWFPNASFIIMTVLTVCGALLSLGLPSLLVSRKVDVERHCDDDHHRSTPPSSVATGRPIA